MHTLTKTQARQFMLMKQGLLGEHKFTGKDGALAYVKQTGCIQFDPVNVHGMNAEIQLNARVKGFKKKMLNDLLYKDRSLFDYPDKQQSIIPTVYWPYFERFRAAARQHGKQFDGLAALEEKTLVYIEKHGPVSSSELPVEGKIRWNSAIHWSGAWNSDTNAARAVLEQLYSTGELIIHHKQGTRKYYDLTARHIPAYLRNAPDPLPDDFNHMKWRVLRRIGAVGLLWNRPSDAFLGIGGLDNPTRNDIFIKLSEEDEIRPLTVEGINFPLYYQKEDQTLLETILQNPKPKPRMELLPPLDCFLWDRKLITALFGYHYAWEIYTPAHKRKYGAYTLPFIYGENFIGRAEPGTQIWYEDGFAPNKKQLSALDSCFKRFQKFTHSPILKN